MQKLRILHENLDSGRVPLSHSRKNPSPSATPPRGQSAPIPPDSPPMPHLEPRKSFSNTIDLSLASSTGMPDARMKDIGGKHSFTDAPDFIGEGEEPSQQPGQGGKQGTKCRGTSASHGKKRKDSFGADEYTGAPGAVPSGCPATTSQVFNAEN